jgi:hypothetical protein
MGNGNVAVDMNLTDAEKLRAANKLIASVVKDLDTSVEICPTCGLRKYHDWEQSVSAKSLQSVQRKITAAIRDLESPPAREDRDEEYEN